MAATSSNDALQMVTFMLGREEYAVDVMEVREFVDMIPVTKLANAPGHVEGVIDLRGSVVPVISLRKQFGLPEVEDGTFTCIAVMDFGGELKGFVIDEVTDVIRVQRSTILPPLDVGGEPWVEGILNLENRLVVVMDLKHLA